MNNDDKLAKRDDFSVLLGDLIPQGLPPAHHTIIHLADLLPKEGRGAVEQRDQQQGTGDHQQRHGRGLVEGLHVLEGGQGGDNREAGHVGHQTAPALPFAQKQSGSIDDAKLITISHYVTICIYIF